MDAIQAAADGSGSDVRLDRVTGSQELAATGRGVKSVTTLSGLLSFMSHRKRAVLLSGIAASALMFGLSRLLPVEYVGESALLIDTPPGAHDNGTGSKNGFIATQVDVLRSRGIVSNVVQKLDLEHEQGLKLQLRVPQWATGYLDLADDYIATIKRYLGHEPGPPGSELVEYVQKHLTAEAGDYSNVVTLRYRAATPRIASLVANSIVLAYQASENQAAQEQVAQSESWFADRAATLGRDLADAERKLVDFARQNDIAQVSDSTVAAIQYSKDSAELASAREDLARQQAAYETIRIGGSSSAQETLDSPTIRDLKDNGAKLTMQIASLTPSDPRRQSIESSLRSISTQIAVETDRVVAALKRSIEISARRIVTLETDVVSDAAKSRDSGLALTSLRILTGDVEAKRQAYTTFVLTWEQNRRALESHSHVLYPATPPIRPSHAFGILAIVLGFFCGVFGWSGWVVLRESFGRNINSTEEMAFVTGLPVIGGLPDVKKTSDDTPLIVETLRAMWLSLDAGRHGDGSVILVTSSEIGEGKTTVVSMLANRLAADGLRVLLVDADLRSPRLAGKFEAKANGSLEALLTGEMSLDMVLLKGSGRHPDCLLAKGTIENPIRALSSDRFENLLTDARRRYDVILLDSPPLLRAADSIVLAKLAQHVLFVVAAGRTNRNVVLEAVRRFRHEDRYKIHTLLTRVRLDRLTQQDYYGGYGPGNNATASGGVL